MTPDNDEPEHIQFLGPTQTGKSHMRSPQVAQKIDERAIARQALLDAARDLHDLSLPKDPYERRIAIEQWLLARADSL